MTENSQLHRRFLAPLIVVLALCSTGCSGPQGTVAAGLDLEPLPQLDLSGPDAAVRDHLTAAHADVERLLADSPRDTRALGEAFGNLGMAYNAYQFLDAAATAYRNAEKLQPGDSRWPYYQGLLHHLQGRLDDAAPSYERVLELEPNDVATLLRLAEVRLEADDTEAARLHFERALELSPRSAAGHYGLGMLALADGNPQRAVERFEQALTAQPTANQVHYFLATAWRRLGEEERSRSHLERSGSTEIVIDDPRLAAVTALGRGVEHGRLRGELALADGRCEEAATRFRATLADSPDDREARAGLAAALRSCGDHLGATDQLLRATLGGPVAGVDGDIDLSGFQIPQRPSMDALEAPVRRRLEELYVEASRAVQQGRGDLVASRVGQLGQLYLTYGLNDAAMRHFEAARQLVPAEPSWSYYLGTLAQIRDPRRARVELRRFVDQQPNDLAGWIRLGQVTLELGDASAAEDAFDKALEIAQGEAAALLGLGHAALAQENPSRALELLHRALKVQPEAGRIHHALGLTYRKLGRLDAARDHLARSDDAPVRFTDPLLDRLGDVRTLTAFEVLLAMAADPEVSHDDHLNFALSKLGDIEGSAEQLDTVLDSPPSNRSTRARLHYVAGGLWVRQQDDDRALAHFRAVVDLAPDHAEAWIKIGNVYARQRQLSEAINAYSSALRLRPDSGAALRKRATAYAAASDISAASRDLERLAELEPGDVGARVQLARAREMAGDVSASITTLQEALQLASDPGARAAVQTALGDTERRRQQFDAAISHYRDALDDDPGADAARHQLAAVLGHVGRYAEAIEHYSKLLAGNPTNTDLRLGLAAGLTLAGRRDEARQRLEEGLAVSPNEPRLLASLEQLGAGP